MALSETTSGETDPGAEAAEFLTRLHKLRQLEGGSSVSVPEQGGAEEVPALSREAQALVRQALGR